MGFCDGLIARNINENCCDRVVRGVEREGVIINRQDVDFTGVTYGSNADGVDKHRIVSLPLKAGKQAYKIIQFGQQAFNGTNESAEVGTVGATFTSNVSFVILENNPDVADFVDGLANGEFVVILENKAKGDCEGDNNGYSAFQIYGLQGGLVLGGAESDKYSDDNLGGWSITLTEQKATLSGQFLAAGSYAANKAIVDSMIGTTPAVLGELHIDCSQVDGNAAGLTVTAPNGTTVSNEEVDDPTNTFMATNLAAGVYTLTYSIDDGNGNIVSCSTRVGVYGYLTIILTYNSLDCAAAPEP